MRMEMGMGMGMGMGMRLEVECTRLTQAPIKLNKHTTEATPAV